MVRSHNVLFIEWILNVQKFLLALLILSLQTGCSWINSESNRPSDPVIRGVNYIGVVVSDVAVSSELYSQATAMSLIPHQQIGTDHVIDKLVGAKNVNFVSQLLRSSNAQLQFMQFDHQSVAAKNSAPVEVHGPGIAHVCYQVAQKTGVYDKFLQHGGSHIGDRKMVKLNDKRPVYYAYAKDNDNIIVEVEHVDIAALELDMPPKNDYRIRHVSLATTDMDSAVEFYSILLEEENPRRLGSLLGFSGEKLDKVSGLKDSKIEMAWFQIRNLELEIIQYLSHPQERLVTPRPFDALGYNSIVFDVKSIALAKQKLLAAGGKLVFEPNPEDPNQVLYGRDLDGNLLGFQVVPQDSPFSAQQFEGNGT